MKRSAVFVIFPFLTIFLRVSSFPYKQFAIDNSHEQISRDSSVVFLVSLDGLRFDYIKKADEFQLRIPNIRRLMEKGFTCF